MRMPLSPHSAMRLFSTTSPEASVENSAVAPMRSKMFSAMRPPQESMRRPSPAASKNEQPRMSRFETLLKETSACLASPLLPSKRTPSRRARAARSPRISGPAPDRRKVEPPGAPTRWAPGGRISGRVVVAPFGRRAARPARVASSMTFCRLRVGSARASARCSAGAAISPAKAARRVSCATL